VEVELRFHYEATQDWAALSDLEFADWTLLPSEAALLADKTGPTRLGFAILLKFFQ
jgi:hypothetical protein